MKKDNHQAINRRDFLKIVGISTATTVALRVQFGQRDGLRFGKLHPYSHGPDDIPHNAVHKRQSFHPRLWMHASADYCQKQRKRQRRRNRPGDGQPAD